ncbi:ABC transporter permease subunit [Paenibacillus sp. 453mf]|uniref:ABC transporter permease subunit n=1 Tax=Paenibacillus sp. 453mf TaxID=1761874 RepID=UPI0008F3D4FD|nr:ABC transporter permease subunit [Paenibacillus sp. 453mf]SFS82323.1 ABC-2 type transport system permease protein [Paenibacillus sp. 453mf]
MNIFWRETKAYSKSLLFWSIGIVLLLVSGMNKFEGTAAGGELNQVIEGMPESLQALMGAGAYDLSKASGYYGMLMLYLFFAVTIHAVTLGANIIAKEEQDRTAEFLFTKPLSRNAIISAKILASLLQIFILNLVTWESSILIVGMYNNGEQVNDDIAVLMIGMLFLQIIFLLVGTTLASVSKRVKQAASTSSGILLAAFILSIAIDLNERLEGLKYFTPFKYFEAKEMMYGGGLDLIYVLLSVLIIAVLLIVTFTAFRKRNLMV